jgi:CubicO group peptidase (beta-lactamase class C family)
LVEQGKLGLDDLLSRWLPEQVLDRVANVSECTVRQLLNHTTGIADVIEDNSYYYWHETLPPNVAQGYFDLYNNGTILNVTHYNTGSGNGYGGLYANVFDLQAFIEALVRNNTVLTPAMLDQMLTFTEPEGTTKRANGPGIFKDFLEGAPDQYAYGRRGRDLGYTADMFWFPEYDCTMVYLLNYGTDAKSALRPYFYEFRKAMLDALLSELMLRKPPQQGYCPIKIGADLPAPMTTTFELGELASSF